MATGTFLTQSEAIGKESCVSILNQDSANAGQAFKILSTINQTVTIQAKGSGLHLLSHSGFPQIGCSSFTTDGQSHLDMSSSWALYRTDEIKADEQLTADDLLQSEWYLSAFFTEQPNERAQFDPAMAQRMLTAMSTELDSVEALLQLEDIKSLETLREQMAKLKALTGEDGPATQSMDDKLNSWRFVCEEPASQGEFIQ